LTTGCAGSGRSMKRKGRLGENNAEDLPEVHLRAMPYRLVPYRVMPSRPAWPSGDGEERKGTGNVTSAFPQRDLLVLITPWFPSR
jgi:hypothetical protein